MSELLWVAVPGGKASAGQVRLRVLVVPKLDPGSPADQGMGLWPPPELAAGTVTVELATSPDATPAAHAATPQLTNQDGLWEAFFGALTVRAPSPPPDRTLEVSPTSQHVADVEKVYQAAAAALPDADSQDAFHDKVREEVAPFAAIEEPAPPPRGTAPPAEQPDFHQVVSLLREHPTVLRALGLIFELTLPVTVLPPATDGVVRVRWPEVPAGLPPVASPWSAFSEGTFLPAPAPDSDLVEGMVAVGRPAWALHTLDADTARGRLRDAARSNGSGPPTLPSLRTAGVLLVRAGRQPGLDARRERGRSNTGRAAEDLPPLTAADLALGYRIDVRIFGQEYRSLCLRTATYGVGQETIATEVAEEGHIKTRAAIDQGDGVLRIDEVVARWDGWSLAAPRPALNGTPSSTGPGRRANGLPFDFHWDIKPEPGSLLKLRFGETYELRARVADVAGGGRELSDPSPDECDSVSKRFVRHEPVASPDLLLPEGVARSDLGPGGKVDLLVVRSGDGATEHPADRRRMLGPPRTTFDVVERHGLFDGAAATTFPLVDQLDTLPDPAADGVSVFLRPEPGGPPADREAKEWPEPWPGFVAKTLTLRISEPGDPTLDWATPHDLVACLEPAEQVTLEVSSFVDPDRLTDFALNDWMPRATGTTGPVQGAVDAVAVGRHPMITPAYPVTLVHAVRRPLAKAEGTFVPSRAEGQTFVTLSPDPLRLGVHTNSTAALQVSAAWDEVDDAGEASPVTGAPVATVAVARGDTELPAVRHELGDTKHRRVTYTLTSISRFRHFFEGGSDADFQTVGTTAEVVVRSAARPIPPVVRSVVPAFTWQEERDDFTVVRRRLGGRVRVELARPWFTTGAGEALAVVIPVDDQPPEALWRFLSQVGRDPLWDTDLPARWPRLPGDRVRLDGTGPEVIAVPHAVWAFGDSRYADVVLPAGDSYCPLAQLAVARYQPDSLDGLELSTVVRTDWVPLLPDRTLTVEHVGSGALVTLDGRVAPRGPTLNRVEVIVEQQTGSAGATTDLVALGDPAGTPSWTEIQSEPGELGETIPVDVSEPGPLRIRVREVELLGVDALAETELQDRVVFTDVVAIT